MGGGVSQGETKISRGDDLPAYTANAEILLLRSTSSLHYILVSGIHALFQHYNIVTESRFRVIVYLGIIIIKKFFSGLSNTRSKAQYLIHEDPTI